MEVYILDSLYRRVDVVDRFESFIWTERRKDVGDCQIVLPSTVKNRALFKPEMALGLNESKRVMLVETIEDITSEDGRMMLKVNGRSLEKILDDRVARYSMNNTTAEPKWTLTGLPKAIGEAMFQRICLDGHLNSGDIIPLASLGTAYSENLPYPSEAIDWIQDPATLLTALKNLCDIYDMGLRLYRNGDSGQLFFNIYTGNDLTTGQSLLAPVVFSPGLETLQSTTDLTTITGEKNVAYVFNEQGFEMVYAPDVDPSVAGFKRKVLLVQPDELALDDPDGEGPLETPEPTPTEISNYLIQEGLNELAKYRPLRGFDGVITENNPYIYEVHYRLGDLVEVRDSDGRGNNMRVSEQIFASDGEGDRSYPTLTTQSVLTPGTWESWLGNLTWSDMGATEYWNTQP